MELKKILIVDDNREEQVYLERAITLNFPCNVIKAFNGEEGLQKIQMESPDLVLLDVAMPVMNGITMLERLRLTYGDSSTPVIALTAMADNYTISKINALGVKHYLLKPVKLEILFEKLEEVLMK